MKHTLDKLKVTAIIKEYIESCSHSNQCVVEKSCVSKDKVHDTPLIIRNGNEVLAVIEYREGIVGEKHYSIASLTPYARENTILINGVSKTYAMTGWRIGYMACPEEVAKAVSAMQGHTTSNACSFAQYASVKAISEDNGFVDQMVKEFDERRKLLIDGLSKIDGIEFVSPKGAFYVFVKVSAFYGKKYDGQEITGSVSFSDALLKTGVAVIPGLAFGDDESVRLSYTVSKADILKGIDRISQFASNLSL